MKAFCLIIAALLLPHFVLSHQQNQQQRHSHNINKVFARRARASHHKHQPTSSRQFRYSRFVQDQDVQQKSTDELEEIEPEIEQQQQMMEKFSQMPVQERLTTKSANQFTQTPFQYETSTPRTLQQKEEDQDFSQLSQPQTGSDFEDELISNDFGEPNQDNSYSSGNKHQGNGQRKSVSNGASHSSDGSESSDEFGNEEDHNTVDWLRQSIRGEPGQDYPIYSSVPETSFKCAEQQYPGYYADVDAQCQVFHMCQENRGDAFLCPNGTIFSQNHFVCVWWFDFDCSSAPQLYSLNSQLYQETSSSGDNGGNGIDQGQNKNDYSSSSKLSSPKENLNKMYVSQIDEFGDNVVTTSAPSYSANGKGSMRSTKNGYKATTLPGQYDISSVESVTPSGIDDGQGYETTPYNLDEALGEEIHSETPLIESLPLTTILPKLSGLSSFGPSTSSPRGYGNSNNNYNNFNQFGSSQMNSYGSNSGNKKQSSYGGSSGVKGGSSKSSKQSSGSSSLPESPARKNSRNGGSKPSYGSSSSQSKGGANKSGLKW